MISKILIGCALGTAAMAAEPNGRAQAAWLTSSATAAPGKPLATAIRLSLEAGWHSYWTNPGESGLPTTAAWKLPPGWRCGPLEHPAPARFVTNGLTGFGHAGEVHFPVTVTPPEDFSGTAELHGEISWLACSEAGCVPGKAQVKLVLTAGEPQPTSDHAAVLAALRQIPHPAGDTLRLDVLAQEKSIVLKLHATSPAPLDPARCEVFPLTPDLLEPQALLRFAPTGDVWTATAPLSGFSNAPLKQLTLVLVNRHSGEAVSLDWPAR